MRIEEVTGIACEVALRDGYHVPTVIADGREGPVIAQFQKLPDTFEECVALLRAAGEDVGSRGVVSDLQRLFLVVEAWVSLGDENRTPVTPPSQDPQRKEVLVISSLQVASQETGLVWMEMRRAEGRLVALQDLAIPEHVKLSVRSPLLAAYAEGYRQAQGE